MALWGNKDSKTASGTIAIADTGAVTGSSTSFTTQAKIGNYIRAGGVDYQIVKIASNTACTVKAGTHGGAIAVVNSGASYTLSEKPAYVAGAESAGSASGVHGNAAKVFGVDTALANGENYASAGRVVEVGVANAGTNYLEVPVVSFSGGGGSSAAATASISGGVVTSIAVTNNGSSYESVPTVSIQVPRRTIPTTDVNTSTEAISYTAHGLANGDAIKYYANGGTALAGLTNATVYYAGEVTANAFKVYSTRAYGTTSIGTLTIATSGVNTTTNVITSTAHGLVDGARLNYSNQGSTTITGLTSGNDYYVVNATANTFQLEETVGGGAIDLTGTGNNSQTFTSTGRLNLTGTGNNDQYFDLTDETTATAVANVGGGTEGAESASNITHAGWVRRTVGTGGRAGRVQYETLVAMGSITGDQSDDRQFPDD